jgi:hypothetical protein
MSVPDQFLDDDDRLCACGNWARIGKRVCYECDAEFTDLYADMHIQDEKESTHGRP